MTSEVTFTVPVEYANNGWHAHSGAGRYHDRWWLALYYNGEQIRAHETKKGLTTYARYEDAKARAARLNKRGVRLVPPTSSVSAETVRNNPIAPGHVHGAKRGTACLVCQRMANKESD